MYVAIHPSHLVFTRVRNLLYTDVAWPSDRQLCFRPIEKKIVFRPDMRYRGKIYGQRLKSVPQIPYKSTPSY